MSFIFDANEAPQDREARKRKAVMGALQAGATQQPTDLGSGLSALGSALAYRAMQGGADPSAGAQAAQAAGWDGFGGMSPQQTAAAQAAPTGSGFDLNRVAKTLFGFGR